MVQEARALETFFRREGAEGLANQAGDLAIAAQAEGYFSTKTPGRISQRTITMGGKTPAQLRRELNTEPFRLGRGAEFLIDSAGFNNPREAREIQLIFPKVRDLDLGMYPTIDQITKRGRELGWNGCPAGVGPYLRLQYTDQPLGNVIWIVMEPITDRDGNPDVFALERSEGGLWLDGSWAHLVSRWSPVRGLVFSLGK